LEKSDWTNKSNRWAQEGKKIEEKRKNAASFSIDGERRTVRLLKYLELT